MIYFTSDQHFFHEKAIKMNNRPFKTADQMDNAIVDNWNEIVEANDEVYILGDVTIKGGEKTHETLSKLKGRKYFIKGNHDHFMKNTNFDDIFVWVKDYAEVEYNNNLFILSHYPFLEWNQFFRGSIHVHGHQHNKMDYNVDSRNNGLRRYDVGVDANNYKPVSAEEIIEFFSELPPVKNNAYWKR